MKNFLIQYLKLRQVTVVLVGPNVDPLNSTFIMSIPDEAQTITLDLDGDILAHNCKEEDIREVGGGYYLESGLELNGDRPIANLYGRPSKNQPRIFDVSSDHPQVIEIILEGDAL